MSTWPAEARAGVHTVATRLKHDLGKYISLQARWLPVHADAQALRDALVSDLLHTRRGPAGSEPAAEVWAPYEAQLTGRIALDDGHVVDLSEDVDVAGIRAGMRELDEVAACLVADTASEHQVARGLEVARTVADHATSLVKRTREES